MNKLTLVTLISSALSAGAFAGSGMNKDKIENTFAELDSDRNGYISQEESKNESVKDYFSKMDSDSDKQLSRDEFNSYLAQNPKHFKDHIAQTASSSMAHQGNQTAQSRSQTDPTVQARMESDTHNEYGMKDGQASTDSEWNVDQEAQKDRSVVAQNERGQNSNNNGMRSSNTGSQQGDDVVAQNEFEMMDTDRDGQISKAEASRSGVNDTFEDIDEDGDQLITRVEYTEYRQNNDYNYEEE